MADFYFFENADGGLMYTKLFENENIPNEPEHREGELYKVLTTFGKTFELR